MAKQITGNGDDGYVFTCADCGFESSGWSSKQKATARGAEHKAEHESGEPMRELADFENGS